MFYAKRNAGRLKVREAINLLPARLLLTLCHYFLAGFFVPARLDQVFGTCLFLIIFIKKLSCGFDGRVIQTVPSLAFQRLSLALVAIFPTPAPDRLLPVRCRNLEHVGHDPEDLLERQWPDAVLGMTGLYVENPGDPIKRHWINRFLWRTAGPRSTGGSRYRQAELPQSGIKLRVTEAPPQLGVTCRLLLSIEAYQLD